MPDVGNHLVGQTELQERVEQSRDALGSDPSKVPWKQLWKVLNTFEQLEHAGHGTEKLAEMLLGRLRDLEEEREIQVGEETKERLKEIVGGKQGERDKYFKLALFWRRHAIWHHLHVHLGDPEGALHLVHRYLIAPINHDLMQETCYPRCASAEETSDLLELASSCRDRLRKVSRWLKEHPEASAILNDRKGKGKGKASNAERTQAEINHLLGCVHEIEPPARAELLILATRDWLDAYSSRLRYTSGLYEELEDKLASKAQELAAREEETEDSESTDLVVDGGIPLITSRRSESIPIPPSTARRAAAMLQQFATAKQVIALPARPSKGEQHFEDTVDAIIEEAAVASQRADASHAPHRLVTADTASVAARSPEIAPESDVAREHAHRSKRRRTMDRGTSPMPEMLDLEPPHVEAEPVQAAKELLADMEVQEQSQPQPQSQSQSNSTDSQNTVQSGVSSTFEDKSPPSPTSLPAASPSPPPPPGQARPPITDVPSSRATSPIAVARPMLSDPTRDPSYPKTLSDLPSSKSGSDPLERIMESHAAYVALGRQLSPPLGSTSGAPNPLPAFMQSGTPRHRSTPIGYLDTSRSSLISSDNNRLEVVKPEPIPSPEKRLVQMAAEEAERRRKMASVGTEGNESTAFAGLQFLAMPAVTMSKEEPKKRRKKASRTKVKDVMTSEATSDREEDGEPLRHKPERRGSLAVSISEIDEHSETSSQGGRERRNAEGYIRWMEAEAGM